MRGSISKHKIVNCVDLWQTVQKQSQVLDEHRNLHRLATTV